MNVRLDKYCYSDMADRYTPQQRSRMMSSVKSTNTKPEIKVRKWLHANGLRFRLHRKDLPGKPDIVLPRLKTVILVHGCFWHQHPGCSKATLPASNREFWADKLARNVERDTQTKEKLAELGWRVIEVWECELKTNFVSRDLHALVRENGNGGRYNDASFNPTPTEPSGSIPQEDA